MRWAAPNGLRDENRGLIHDDIVLAVSLVPKVYKLEWNSTAKTLIIPGRDPLVDMSRFR